MIKLIKEHIVKFILLCCVLVLDILMIVLALVPSKMDVTAPGGLNEVKSVIEADTDSQIKGSFNTIYVYSIDRASILQTFVASFAKYNDISEASDVFHLSKQENYNAGVVQKNQSIEASLICAYRYAKIINPSINIDYKLTGFIVRNYQINNKIFKIGDLITSVYDVNTNKRLTLEDYDDLSIKVSNNNFNIGDEITFIRNNEEHKVTITEPFDYENGLNCFFVYLKFDINTVNTYPKYTLHEANTLGPSGGLLQTLSVYSQITGIDLTYGKKIAGTGTISVGGTVGKIGGVSQKIVTAIHNGADVFLCPEDNYLEAYETYINTWGHDKMKLIKVSTFVEAVKSLGELYGN